VNLASVSARTWCARASVLCFAGAISLCSPAGAGAQDEATLRSNLEGMRVVLKIDMPGTSDGVDLRVDSNRPLDFRQHGDRLRACGAAIRAGDSALVTFVRVKNDLIEFQLDGGGFGTFGDDTSTSVYMPLVSKSEREKELEERVRNEDNSRRRRELQRELEELRDRRQRENRRIDVARAEAEERKRDRVAEQRLNGGSRFNLRYDGAVPVGITPAEVRAALADYVDFFAAGVDVPPPPIAAEPLRAAGDLLHKGMSRPEVERELGKPTESSDRREGALTVTTLVFLFGEQRISVEFVEGMLVRYTITSR
jgi:hypothetical protein